MNPEDILYEPITDKPPEKPVHDFEFYSRRCRKCGLDLVDYMIDSTPCTKLARRYIR